MRNLSNMKFYKLGRIIVALLIMYLVLINYDGLKFAVFRIKNLSCRLRITPFQKEATIESLTSARHVESVDPNNEVLPTYATYDVMLEDDAHASNTRSFPESSACPYRGIRKPFVTNVVKTSQSLKCHRRQLTPTDCADTLKYFGQQGSMKASECDTHNAIEICTISERKNYRREDIEINCDVTACKGKQLSLGLFNDAIGKIVWHTDTHIERLRTHIKNNIMTAKFAPGFVLLKCEGGQGIQVLKFPRILDRLGTEQKKRKRFNINIVLEDCIARAHFYRTLSKTASTFREIIYNQSIPSTLLEFEKVQGYLPHTYGTLQRLFTGLKYWDSKSNCDYKHHRIHANNPNYTCTHGVEEMLARYKKAGYSTLAQEDACWFDAWGSLLDPRKRVGVVKDEKSRLKRWEEYVGILETSGRWQVVEDFAMSVLACNVYAQHNETNPYSTRTMPKVCFAGRHYSSHLLEYLKRYTEMNDMAAQPFVAYTHLLTSHDTHGRRIVDDDEGLADFFRQAAHLHNTVTIFLSDHGGKASSFAAYTTQGREEVFQPFLFMIVPHEVSKLLGSAAMNALVVNQNRLVGVEDLYHSLVSILDTFSSTNLDQQTKPELTRLRGLFKPVPLDRTCEEMKIRSDALCLCEGMDKTLPSDAQILPWAAEFALGTLNNRIQEQYTTALRSESGMLASGFYGYGACQRYTGKEIRNARQRFTSSEEKLIFSLLVEPLGLKTLEIFDVEVSFSKRKATNGITLDNLIRVSQYNKYEKCTDKGVDHELCACNTDQRMNTQWRNTLYSKTISRASFKVRSELQILNRCLTIVSRNRKNDKKIFWSNAIHNVLTYEAINACPDVTYNMTISFKEKLSAQVSLKHPGSVTLLPRTVTFLLTVNIYRTRGKFTPRFKFQKIEYTR